MTVQFCLPFWNSPSSVSDKPPTKKIEDYRPGYPRYAALLSTNGPFFLCRRFNKLRARILLLKQDRLSMLEQRLDQVDQEESSALFLGKSRADRNPERISLQSEIETCLADYDKFAERTYRSLSFAPAHQRDVESLQNWLSGTGCLAREETAYLTYGEELASLAPEHDSAVMGIEAWVESQLIRFYRGFRNADKSLEPFSQCVERPQRVYLFRSLNSTKREGHAFPPHLTSAAHASSHLQHD
ncbi:hypothetical protein XA68_17269 [Ophiocordyceps unilateralis]|uniref:DUF6594 domain-containing protein n=1 Tax=Ophiocordyceps unilateralis TaxID=268505 RepID=A0A2A9PS49_OPHUN|nr:hypothetical protein XA68_17269 [Ophiocordyceps unilateralis]